MIKVVVVPNKIAVVAYNANTAVWGGIGGSLSNQTDLVAALAAKYDASNPAGYISSINNNMVVAALGYTPYNATNPAGYITGITGGMVSAALGYTPYNATNPAGYISGITSGMITTALGFTPYDSANPAGYITSSALSNLVPYTGANNPVDLGSTNTLTAKGFIVSGSGGNGNIYFPRQLANPAAAASTGFNIFADVAAAFAWVVKNGTDTFIRKFSSSLTANRAYTLQDANGTLAFTSDITTALAPYLLSATAASTYLTITNAAATYQPIGTYESALTFSSGLTRTVNTITANLITGKAGGQTVIGGTAASEVLTLNSTVHATKGTIQIGSTDLINIGNATSANQRLVRIGQDTAFLDMGSRVGTTSQFALYFNQATPSSTNHILVADSASTFLNAGTTLTFQVGASAVSSVTAGAWSFTPQTRSSGAVTAFTFTNPANTNQTTTANIPSYLINTGSRQWANGTIALQEEVKITGAVYSHISGSNTITKAGTLNVYAPTTSGGFTTITAGYAIISNGNVNIVSSASGTGLLVEGTSGVSQIITIKNSGGNTGLSMDAGLKALFYGGGGLNYPVVASSADINAGVGFASSGVALITGSTARLQIANTNMGFGGASFGGGTTVFFMANATAVPSSNATGGGIIYVESGALKYRGSSGTITVLGVA